MKKLEKDIEPHKKSVAKIVKEQKKYENQLVKVRAKLESIRGPFKNRFDTVLDGMHLKRVALQWITCWTGHKKTKTVFFGPLQIAVDNTTVQEFGTHKLCVKNLTLYNHLLRQHPWGKCIIFQSPNRQALLADRRRTRHRNPQVAAARSTSPNGRSAPHQAPEPTSGHRPIDKPSATGRSAPHC